MNELGAVDWLAALRPALPALDTADWELLADFEHVLAAALPAAADRPERDAAGLLAVRAALAGAGFADVCLPAECGGRGRTLAVQGLLQFVAGFYDTDLRDATGSGHGRMIQRHAGADALTVWQPRMLAGALIGIAATERHGGSRLPAITTRARPRPAGGWWLSGEKTWISRLHEAGAFVVFFTGDQGIGAGLVPADAPGLTRTRLSPAGLSGWSWGALHLADVPLDPGDLLGGIGQGLAVFDEHFTVFRPLVTATALGAAASVHDYVTGTLRGKLACGILATLRDSTLARLGEAHAQITAALLHTLATLALAEHASSQAALFSRTGKAAGVALAHRAAADLALLVGAAGFQDGHRLVKTRRDLEALQLADGIAEELLRSGGRILTTARPAPRHTGHAATRRDLSGADIHA